MPDDPKPAPAPVETPSAAAPASSAAAPSDDGFTAEERQAFEDMRNADAAAPAGDQAAAPADGAAGSSPDGGAAPGAAVPAAAKTAAGGPAVDGDGDDGDDDDEPAAGATPGAPPVPGEKPPPRRVSYGKFKRVEERLKSERAENEQRKIREAKLDERLKILNEALTTPPPVEAKPKPADDPEPDPEADIFGWVKWSQRERTRLNNELNGQREALHNIYQGKQAEGEDAAVAQHYATDAQQFVQKEPNFVPAYQFLMQSRLAELAMYYDGVDVYSDGATLSPEQIQRIRRVAASEERQLVTEAIRAGQSPAERVFRLARSRGFRPAAPGAAPPPPPVPGARPNGNGTHQPNGNGAAAPPAAAAPAQPSVIDEIARIKAGQGASLSLSNAGGTTPIPLDARRLADMPESEFRHMVENMAPEQLKAILGG